MRGAEVIAAKHDDTVVGDLVEAVWLDAAFDLDEPPEPITMHTVGWLTDSNEQWITIAQERDSDAYLHRGYTTVLRANLVSVLRLEQVRE